MSKTKVKMDGTSTKNVRNDGFKMKQQGLQDKVDTGAPYRGKYTKRNSTTQQRRAYEEADTAVKMSESNPLELYTKFADYAYDAATLPFAKPLGTPVLDGVNWLDGKPFVIPGVMRIQFYPAIGISKDFRSPMNRSSIRFYTYMRSNQKASGNYDHQDITMMEVAMDSCYMYHALLARMYKVMRSFVPVNDYYPRALVTAMGGDFDDLNAHLQDFRAYINNFAYSLGQYALPKGIALFDRHCWMCDGLYVDSSTTRAQTYIFVPSGFYKYNNTVSTGSQCDYVAYLNTGKETKTFEELKAFGDALINAVSNEEDFAVISGDIYNFYGGDVYSLPYLNENDMIVPAFDKVVLSQIENLTIVGDITNNSIKQNPGVNQGAIIYDPILNNATGGSKRYVPGYMNFHWDSPKAADVIEASRLKAVISQGDTVQTIVSCGTELVRCVDSYTIKDDGYEIYTQHATYELLGTTATYTEFMHTITNILELAQYDWAPLVQVRYVDTSVTPAAEGMLGLTWDVDVFDVVPDNYLAQLHTACLMSLFEVGTNRK